MIARGSGIVFMLISLHLAGQGYDSVKLENGDTETDNILFSPGYRYIYEVTIIRDGTSMLLEKNDHRSWNFIENDSDSLNRISLTVINPKKSKKTNKRQTEVVYSDLKGLGFIESTGVVENENNLWLHPPRTGFFKSLETCPFPYIRFPLEPNEEWHDEMTIGPQWSHPDWLEWEGNLKWSYTYRVTGEDEEMSEEIGEEVWQIEGIAVSEKGTSKLLMWFSKSSGFQALHFELPNGDAIEFELADRRRMERVFNTIEELWRYEKGGE